MAFFCIVGALICLPPHTATAWAYTGYWSPPVLQQAPQPLQRPVYVPAVVGAYYRS